MKRENPPFDPPYISIHPAEQGVTYIETLADGATRPVSAAQANWMQRSESDAGTTPPPTRAQPAKSGSAAKSGNHQGKTLLKVPFAEKEAAKALGAKWDATKKKWYVPHGVDVQLFSRWL